MQQTSQTVDRPIFLTIHYAETKKRIAERITKINADLGKEWSTDQAAFRAKYGLTNKQGLKAVTFKTTHLTTLFAVMVQYAEYLKTNRTQQLVVAKNMFRMNNAGISTALSKPKYDAGNGIMVASGKTSSWRHISKAIQFGILKNKVLHGSNSGYEIEFDLNLLVADYNEEYCELLVDNYKKLFKTLFIPDAVKAKLIADKPLFLDFPLGRMLPSCNHTVTEILYLRHNYNMLSGVAAEKSRDVSELPSREQGNADHQPDKSTQEQVSRAETHESEARKVPPPPEQREALTAHEMKYVRKTVHDAWNFAFRTIFSNKLVTEDEVRKIYNFLFVFFTYRTNDRSPFPSEKEMKTRLDCFCERIILARKYQLRKPGYTFMNPVTYFNPTTASGFINTQEWYKQTLEKRKENAEYNMNNKRLAIAYRKYRSNPSAETYREVVQTISKRKDQFLLDTFNNSVVMGEEIPESVLQQTFELQKT